MAALAQEFNGDANPSSGVSFVFLHGDSGMYLGSCDEFLFTSPESLFKEIAIHRFLSHSRSLTQTGGIGKLCDTKRRIS